MGSEVRHRYACMHMYSTATSIYTHLVMSVVIPFALIQINEHNRKHYPGAAAAVHPTPLVSGAPPRRLRGTACGCDCRIESMQHGLTTYKTRRVHIGVVMMHICMPACRCLTSPPMQTMRSQATGCQPITIAHDVQLETQCFTAC